ncbi:MAG: pyridoxal-phosphate dependent enzyme [Candidatus Sumerlaeia bacterium]|nr:pyridoxal-phosphate dependent enzyme [Candidatus Sumerlaeia bacterium]
MTAPWDRSEIQEQLFEEILHARQRVYAVARPTPLEKLPLPVKADVYLKREDLSPINSYKWRGAYNRMVMLSLEERSRGVVTASAGNHAQGVALAAARMEISARIYMPFSTPRMKQLAVKRHGGEYVDVVLHGDSLSEAAALAQKAMKEEELVYIHPYDDMHTMGGQGTIADEIVMSGIDNIDVAYLQIGGGGMAAAVACWLKTFYPDIRIVGVEGVGQASMKSAVEAGTPVDLDYVDVFSDGTAVRRAGTLTHALCSELIDEFITVTNEELCAAIQLLWEARRVIPEPAGAMGVAGLMKDADNVINKRALCILCGANMDFGQLAWIARHAGIGSKRRRYYRFEISEKRGSFLNLLESCFEDINIVEFQYGKRDHEKGWPVIGFEASPIEMDLLRKHLTENNIPWADVTSQVDVEFRLIHYEPASFIDPYFITYEFPERAGALRDFLRAIRETASLCYFNYVYTGEAVGRALLGFEFENADSRVEFLDILVNAGHSFHEVSPDTVERII